MFTSVDSPIAVKLSIKLLWILESLGITESPSTSENDVALDHFNNTVKFVDGRCIMERGESRFTRKLSDVYW